MPPYNRKQFAKRRLDDLLRSFAQPLSQSRKNHFWSLVHAVRASTSLLVPFPERGRTDPREAERVVRACARMSERCHLWQQRPEFWPAPQAPPFVQFRSLVSHLFDQHPVPNFMARVWMGEDEMPWELALYLHLAAGHSIRQFDPEMGYPVRMTKQAARFFMQAPDDVLPIEAYRWAQVRALGGDDRLARLLMMSTTLYVATEHEEFWESVIRFLIRNLPISSEEISAIIWFIDQQKFRPAETVWRRGAGKLPLQPKFTLRGRSLMSLRRHMANWPTDLQERRPELLPLKLERQTVVRWQRTLIDSFRLERDHELWTIDELLTDRELRAEGGIMRHCVAKYIHYCVKRRTSIWSMRVHRGERYKRVLTVEVDPEAKMILQAKGKRNSAPSELAMEMLHRWANQVRLRFQKIT